MKIFTSFTPFGVVEILQYIYTWPPSSTYNNTAVCLWPLAAGSRYLWYAGPIWSSNKNISKYLLPCQQSDPAILYLQFYSFSTTPLYHWHLRHAQLQLLPLQQQHFLQPAKNMPSYLLASLIYISTAAVAVAAVVSHKRLCEWVNCSGSFNTHPSSRPRCPYLLTTQVHAAAATTL